MAAAFLEVDLRFDVATLFDQISNKATGVVPTVVKAVWAADVFCDIKGYLFLARSCLTCRHRGKPNGHPTKRSHQNPEMVNIDK